MTDNPFFTTDSNAEAEYRESYKRIMGYIPPTAQNSCIDATGRYHDDLGRFTNKIGWFVDGVLNNSLKPLTNAIKVGELSKNVVKFLKANGIEVGKSEIELTYGKIEHSMRATKKEAQKVTPDQLKRTIKIISENNVFFDTVKRNLIYVSKLPPDEIKNNRDWLKIPVNINQKDNKNYIATMSIIKADDIFKQPQYKKID